MMTSATNIAILCWCYCLCCRKWRKTWNRNCSPWLI